MSDELNEADEQRLDWGLAEVEAEEIPPDLATRILARLRAGDLPGDEVPDAIATRGGRRTMWAAAALVLIGVGVLSLVAGLITEPDDDWKTTVPEPPQDPPQLLPPPIEIVGAEDISRLPEGTRNARLLCARDEWLPALVARCPSLERLDLSWDGDGVVPPSITDAGLRHIAKLRQLRELNLSKCALIEGDGLRHLRVLSQLQSLSLARMDLADEHFEHLLLASLRELDLSYNHGFGHAGMKVVASLPGLRRLSLRSCSQLEERSLMKLLSARLLEELDLRELDGFHFRTSKHSQLYRPKPQRHERDPQRVRRGVTKLVMSSLSRLPRLQKLDLTGVVCSLTWPKPERFPGLRWLSLAGCQGVTPDSVEQLGLLPGLEHLDLYGGSVIHTTAAGDQYWLAGVDVSDRALAELSRLGTLRALRIGHGSFTAKGLQSFSDMASLEVLATMDSDAIDGAALRHLPPTIRRLSLAGCGNVDDDALEVVAYQFPRLEALDVSRCAAVSQNGVGKILHRLQLRSLRVAHCKRVGIGLLPLLEAQTRLELLDVSGLAWWKPDHSQRLRARLPHLTLVDEPARHGIELEKGVPPLEPDRERR